MMTRDDIIHVDGDIDKVDWNVDIMPKRIPMEQQTDEVQNPKEMLSGKDIVYLAEMSHRLAIGTYESYELYDGLGRLRTSSEPLWNKNKERFNDWLDQDLLNKMTQKYITEVAFVPKVPDKISYLRRGATSDNIAWVKEFKTLPVVQDIENYNYAVNLNMEDLEEAFEFYKPEDQESNAEKFKTDYPLELENIENLFKDFKKMDKYLIDVFTHMVITSDGSDAFQIDDFKHYEGKDVENPITQPSPSVEINYYAHRVNYIDNQGKDYSLGESYYTSAKDLTLNVVTDTMNGTEKKVLAVLGVYYRYT